MGKGIKRGALFHGLDVRARPRRCLACRVVLTGKPADRCPSCANELRKRKRRKPR